MNTKLNDIGYIESELAAIRGGMIRSWGQIGMLLIRVEETGYWQSVSGSFTEWLKNFCHVLSLKEGSLWRYFSVARNYEQTRHTLVEMGIDAPMLATLPDKVSPENLEIFFKLMRVVPKDELKKLAGQVLSASISRAKLRDFWVAYRPVLEGQTARGKGVTAPRIDPSDMKYGPHLLEAKTLTTFLANNVDWLGVSNPHIYTTFLDVDTQASGSSNVVEFDAVVAVQESASAPMLLHGIEVKATVSKPIDGKGLNHRCTRLLEFCDLLWVVVHELQREFVEESLFDFIGLITVTNDTFNVVRPARRHITPKHSGELAKDILKLALRA